MTRALQKVAARRSAAAKKGWERRRAAEAFGAGFGAGKVDMDALRAQIAAGTVTRLPGYERYVDLNPWVRIQATIKRFWHTATGWMR